MKKFLLTLVTLLAAVSVNAAEVTFDFTNPAGLTPSVDASGLASSEFIVVNDMTFTNGGVSVTFSKGTATTDCRLWKGTSAIELRTYTNSSMTIATTNGDKITSIELSGSATNVFSVTPGTYASGTWTGEATSVVFTNTKTAKINTITVTTVAAGEIVVDAPSITPAGGYFYNGIDTPVDVEITCSDADAKIYYSVAAEGETPNFVAYTGKFQVAETCTVAAYAEKQGVKSSETSAYFTIQDVVDVASLDAFMALEDQTVARLTSPLTVVYSSTKKGEMYVTDGKSLRNLLVYSKDVITANEYKAGDKIAAGAVGTKTTYNGAAQMQYAVESTFAAGVAGDAVTPIDIEIANITADDYNKYVIVKDVTISEVSGSNATAQKGTATVALYNRYSGDGVAYPTDLTSTYAITGFLVLYKDAIQMYPVKFEMGSGVEGVDNNEVTILAGNGTIYVNGTQGAVVYNAAGQVVVNSLQNNIAVAPGFYIVKAGNTVEKVLVK